MNFVWRDYDPGTMEFVETWLDKAAVSATGLDEGFRDFYEYWAAEPGFSPGENFWCKVISQGEEPVALMALCHHEGETNVMELVVAPQKRGQGIGAAVLQELLETEEILGFAVHKSEAVIFPGNTPSQRAFEKAGYRHRRTHPDGTALYFVYEREKNIPEQNR